MLAVVIFALGATVSPQNYSAQTQTDRTAEQKPEYVSAAEQANERTAQYTFWLTIFTGVLAASTIGLWIVTWRVGRRQAKDTRILQRAYLSVEPFGVNPWLPDEANAPQDASGQPIVDHKVVGHVRIRNVGKLPAGDVRWVVQMAHCDDKGEREEFQITETEYGGGTLAPGGIIRWGAKEQGIEQRGFYYVWGRVLYADGFGHPRETKFCHRYTCRRVRHGRIKRKYARHHHHGNDAD